MTDGRRTEDGAARRPALLATVKAVAWSFFGVRARKAHEEDLGRLNPIHVIVIGVVLAALFVVALLAVVNVVVGK